MEFKHKIFEGLKNTPEGWRFCNCWKKAAKGGGNQYDSPYTLEQVLELDGDGVEFYWWHSPQLSMVRNMD